MAFNREGITKELETKVGLKVFIDLNEAVVVSESILRLSGIYYEVLYNLDSIEEKVLESGSGSAYNKFKDTLNKITKSLEIINSHLDTTTGNQTEVLRIVFKNTLSSFDIFSSNLSTRNYKGIEKFLKLFKENFSNEVDLYNYLVSARNMFSIQMPMVLANELKVEKDSEQDISKAARYFGITSTDRVAVGAPELEGVSKTVAVAERESLKEPLDKRRYDYLLVGIGEDKLLENQELLTLIRGTLNQAPIYTDDPDIIDYLEDKTYSRCFYMEPHTEYSISEKYRKDSSVVQILMLREK